MQDVDWTPFEPTDDGPDPRQPIPVYAKRQRLWFTLLMHLLALSVVGGLAFLLRDLNPYAAGFCGFLSILVIGSALTAVYLGVRGDPILVFTVGELVDVRGRRAIPWSAVVRYEHRPTSTTESYLLIETVEEDVAYEYLIELTGLDQSPQFLVALFEEHLRQAPRS